MKETLAPKGRAVHHQFLTDDAIDFASMRRYDNNMIWINENDFTHKWPAYFRRVEAGERLVVVRAGKPIIEMHSPSANALKMRPSGLCVGEFTVPDDFDRPLPEDILNDFEGA